MLFLLNLQFVSTVFRAKVVDISENNLTLEVKTLDLQQFYIWYMTIRVPCFIPGEAFDAYLFNAVGNWRSWENRCGTKEPKKIWDRRNLSNGKSIF